MNVREKLLRLHWCLSAQFGIDILKAWLSIRGIGRYVRDLSRFWAVSSGRLELVPCLHDWHEEGGATKNEYFWQDLLVARKIFAANPEIHVDIGSRVDGFVAHVASFREIRVFDIRPITARIPGVTFMQADLMNPGAAVLDYCDSLSCLHALEHFGLGRYGDPIDPKGYESGIRNMAMILRANGIFYLSVPVGIERVEFNAQYVFNPKTIVTLAKNNQLCLQQFYLFTPENGLVEMGLGDGLAAMDKKRYGLGIFIFKKITA